MQPDLTDPTTPGYFHLEELEVFQGLEGRTLTGINYYFWLHYRGVERSHPRFLYAVELLFDSDAALLLSSGDDSAAIRILPPEELIKTAHLLQALHGQVSMQRAPAGESPLWQPVLGKGLVEFRLTKNETGLFHNDALLLDFGVRRILLGLSLKEGLELGIYPEK